MNVNFIKETEMLNFNKVIVLLENINIIELRLQIILLKEKIKNSFRQERKERLAGYLRIEERFLAIVEQERNLKRQRLLKIEIEDDKKDRLSAIKRLEHTEMQIKKQKEKISFLKEKLIKKAKSLPKKIENMKKISMKIIELEREFKSEITIIQVEGEFAPRIITPLGFYKKKNIKIIKACLEGTRKKEEELNKLKEEFNEREKKIGIKTKKRLEKLNGYFIWEFILMKKLKEKVNKLKEEIKEVEKQQKQIKEIEKKIILFNMIKKQFFLLKLITKSKNIDSINIDKINQLFHIFIIFIFKFLNIEFKIEDVKSLKITKENMEIFMLNLKQKVSNILI